MKLNRLFKSVLKTAIYIMDHTGDQVERVSDRASQIVEGTKSVIYPDRDHTLRNALTFAAGVGVGIGVGVLLAPSSGAEMRSLIGEKVQNIGGKVRDLFSTENPSSPTHSDAV